MTAAVQFMLTRATLFEAARDGLADRVPQRTQWGHVRPVAGGLIVLVPLALVLGRQFACSRWATMRRRDSACGSSAAGWR